MSAHWFASYHDTVEYLQIAAPMVAADVTKHVAAPVRYRGSSAEILCADHLGRDTPYLLYLPGKTGSARLRPREVFPDLAGWLLRRTVPTEYHAMIDPETPEALGGMIFELFKNTQDHARVDCSGNLLEISIRALKTLHHAIRPEQLVAMVGDYARDGFHFTPTSQVNHCSMIGRSSSFTAMKGRKSCLRSPGAC